MTRLDIRLLGNFEVRLDGELVDDFESDTVRALLALLAVDPGRSWSRASMAELLWPDRAPGAALGNLRHALTVLRHAIGESASGRPYLRVTTGELTVDRGASVFVDVVELERLASTPIEAHGAVAAWERAASLLRGDVLAGIDLRAGEGWDAWLAAVRASVTRNATDVLDRLATLRERTGEHAQAELHVRHLLELDPWNERGHRQLVRVLALQGRTAHAIAHAERLEQRLGDELGVTLDPTTAELVERVRSGEFPPPRSMKPAALLAERREPPRPQFVDRSNELDWLETQLDDSLAGAGRVVLVAGEVGSGKSMLLEAFARRATERMPNLLVGRGHCNAYTGAGDPYLPFRHVLATLCGDVTHEWASGALTPEQVTTIWDGLPEAVAVLLDEGPYLLGSLVDPVTLQTRLDRGLPDAPVTSRLRTTWAELAARATDPMRQQQPLIDQCGRVLLRLAEHRPVVVLIDDLHWADDGTIDLLAHLARQLRGSTLLVVAAYRPEEVWPDGNDALHRRPAQRLIHELRSLVDDGELELGDRRDFVDEWLDGRPNLLGESFRHQLYATTRGHPLFTVEVVQDMQRRGELHVDSGGRLIARPDLGWDAVPPRVEAVIAERLASLPPAERSDLEVASVQGETFEPNIVAAVRAVSTTELAERLGRLAASPQPLIVGDISSFDRGIPTSVFRFRHALFQRVLYNALSAPTRRVLHASTARAMLAAQPDGDGRSVELARHFDEGGLGAEAADQYVRAGRRAMQMSATEQAIRLLGRALELIDADIAPTTTPTESDRHRQLAVLTALGSCLQARLGYTAPQTDVVYERIRALAVQEGPTFEAVQALGAVVTVDCLRARYERARAGTDALLDTASQLGLPLIEAVAHMQAGLVELVTGHPQVADQHCRSAFERYDPATDGWLTYVVGQDVGSTNLAWWSIAAWELGRLGEAGQLANRSVAAARATGHPFSVAFALSIAGCLVPFLRGEPRRALAAADEVARIADAEDFAFYRAAALVHGGLARAAAGEVGRGMRDLERGLAGWRELGTDAFACWIRTAQADLLVRAGHLDWAERLLVELRDALTDTGEDLALVRWWLAQGRLFAAQGEDARAEHALRHALEIGADRCQWGASLQVATALAALLRGSGSGEAADADLRLLLERITDGEDTNDVRAARALLT